MDDYSTIELNLTHSNYSLKKTYQRFSDFDCPAQSRNGHAWLSKSK